MKTRTTTILSKNTKTTFVADDGTEFETATECKIYEFGNAIREAFDVFSLRKNIYDDNIAFEYRSGHDELFAKMCTALVCAEIEWNKPENPIYYPRDLSNVYELRKQTVYEAFFANEVWKDGNTYTLDIRHTECSDTWDYFKVVIHSADSERERIKAEIEHFETLFKTKL